ncbi:FAD-binding domain-containing protein [Lasiosphaeria hispida]|uniref:FAD-binding domain-containing protein n=1 Tax=Lasiosphaeria hispida TaxID=260671 RepID=A0AAJ0HL89_9PEZI|nr:FAD-binding domain-containing protein [Lasiosphaeria hispida]
MAISPATATGQRCCHLATVPHLHYLTDEEIEEFLDDLDPNGDGLIDYDEVEQNLDHTYDELFTHPTTPKKHVDDGNETGSNQSSPETDQRHLFLRSIIGSDARRIPRGEFAERVRQWRIPSLALERGMGNDYVRKMSTWRRVRAYWAVNGPQVVFLTLVISMQVTFAVWQLVKYSTAQKYRNAFGWGVIMAKTCAGALYPTMFFLLLSMSRYCSTYLRQSYRLSRFINWDLSQSFHIKISITAVVLSTLHAIGHLTGTFNKGSQPANEGHVNDVLGPGTLPRTYMTYVAALPGWTGLTALVLFFTLGTLSAPPIRRWNFEVFQLGHLLMYPIIALLYAHGSEGMLQYPMLGYWLAFPTLMIVVERSVRFVAGFFRIPATLRVLDAETVEITVTMPNSRFWGYKAGQYVLVQVPQISFFQWHPFTVSVCVGKKLQLHIKTDGNWTRKLRGLADASGRGAKIEVGIHGPFGAPAQRFYDFSHTIIVGSGIGVTPFSGILADLQARDNAQHGGPSQAHKRSDSPASSLWRPFRPANNKRTRKHTLSFSSLQKPTTPPPPPPPPKYAPDYRRVDFHWTVRERNCLLWMSDLLNDVSRSQQWHRAHDADGPAHLDIRIHTHVTQRRSTLAAHVYGWLLEMHRTDAHPESPLTRLLNPTHLGRPDFVMILDAHYGEMKRFLGVRRAERASRGRRRTSGITGVRSRVLAEDEGLKIGVFYCGAPVVGEILADRCRALTARGHEDGSKIEYHFMTEVFC